MLRDGILQQVDRPQNLYNRPVNLFVGGFIGSPSMNLVGARLVREDGGAAVTFAGYRLPVLKSMVHDNPGIAAYFGRDVILGIRPSDFEDASLTEESWPRMTVETHLTEALGTEIHVIFAIAAPPVEHKDVADLAPPGEEDESAIPLYGASPCGRHRSARVARSGPATGSSSGWIRATCTSSTQAADWRSAASKRTKTTKADDTVTQPTDSGVAT